MTKFNVGDIVVKMYGKKPIELTYVSSGSRMTGKYLHNGNRAELRTYEVKLYENKEEDVMNKSNGLYCVNVDGTEKFAVKVGLDSQNRWIMEEKGTGAILIAQESDVTEVLPYTVEIKPLTNNQQNGHYIVTPGALEKGDLVLTESGLFGIVIKLDTKQKSARQTKMRKVQSVGVN